MKAVVEKLYIVISHLNFHIVPCFAAESHGARNRSLPLILWIVDNPVEATVDRLIKKIKEIDEMLIAAFAVK